MAPDSRATTTEPTRGSDATTQATTPAEGSVRAVLDAALTGRPATSAFEVWEQGAWRGMSFEEIDRRAQRLSSYLRERGLEPGARLAILCDAGPEWGVAFLTAVRAGGVALPLDGALSVGELGHIVADARPSWLLASARHLDTARALRERLDLTHDVIALEEQSAAPDAPSYASLVPTSEAPSVVERSWGDAIVLTYTAGTTGQPKGVMTTFRSLHFEVTSLRAALAVEEGEAMVSVLPLHQLLGLTAGFLLALLSGGSLALVRSLSPDVVLPALIQRRPTRLLAVPMFLRLLRQRALERAATSSLTARAWFLVRFHVLAWVPSRALRRRLFGALRRDLSVRCLRSLLSGGAPLDDATERFFRRIGLPVYQGYGLTEAGPVLAINTPRAHRPGTVGRPLPGVEVRIARDGEILTRGPHVMAGYSGDGRGVVPADLDEQGWFATGDLGAVDPRGYLRITGRKKDLIVLGSGQRVQPEEVELAFEGEPAFAEVCVVGVRAREAQREEREEVACVVVPSEELRARYPNDDELEDAAAGEARRVAESLAPFKRPTFVVVTRHPLPRTASRKLKRAVVRALVEKRRGTQPP